MKNSSSAKVRIEELVESKDFSVSEKDINWVCEKLEEYFNDNPPLIFPIFDEYGLRCEWEIDDIEYILNIYFKNHNGYFQFFCNKDDYFAVSPIEDYIVDNYYYDNIDLNDDNKWGEIADTIGSLTKIKISKHEK